MENRTISIGVTVIKTVTNTCEVSEFDYNPPFSDELKNLGGVFEPIKFKFVFNNCTDKKFEEIVEVCNYYYTPQNHYTSGQRNLIKKVKAVFDGCSEDFIFRKDDDGMSFVDLNEVCGTPQKISTVLHSHKIKVIKTTPRRIYISN